MSLCQGKLLLLFIDTLHGTILVCAVFPPLSLTNVTVYTQNLKLYFESRDVHSGYSDGLWAGWQDFDTRQAQEIFSQPHGIQT